MLVQQERKKQIAWTATASFVFAVLFGVVTSIPGAATNPLVLLAGLGLVGTIIGFAAKSLRQNLRRERGN